MQRPASYQPSIAIQVSHSERVHVDNVCTVVVLHAVSDAKVRRPSAQALVGECLWVLQGDTPVVGAKAGGARGGGGAWFDNV